MRVSVAMVSGVSAVILRGEGYEGSGAGVWLALPPVFDDERWFWPRLRISAGKGRSGARNSAESTNTGSQR